MENNQAIQNRYDFVMLFDVENGNPNGDPDAGNLPRTDPETSLGLVTDVCLKRKIRNFVALAKADVPGYQILIRTDRPLNEKFTEAYDAEKLEKGRKKETPMSDQLKAQKYMCRNYYDVRTFGAVMSTGNNPCGIVRGPVQLNFARSIDPVLAEDITITRQAKTTIDRQEKGMTEIGKKSLVYYGLYRAEGYISASLAQRVTGFGEEDLELLWTAIINMFENDHSAARGKMCMRKLYVFRHDSVLGNAPSHVLFDKITITKKADVVTPRKFSDYTIAVDRQLPDGVTLLEKI